MDLLAHLAADSARFHDALADAGPDAPVPACPDWTGADLLWHLTRVHWMFGEIVSNRLLERPDPAGAPARPDDHAAALALFRSQSERLLTAFAEVQDPTERVYSWVEGGGDVAWALRRQAHEAFVHRADAEQTAGLPVTSDPEMAADGLDELMWAYVHGVPDWGTFTTDGTTATIIADDGLARSGWTLTLGRMTGTAPGRQRALDLPAAMVTVTSENEDGTGTSTASADAVVRGPATALHLWAWGRGPLDGLTVDGNHDAVAALRTLLADVT